MRILKKSLFGPGEVQRGEWGLVVASSQETLLPGRDCVIRWIHYCLWQVSIMFGVLGHSVRRRWLGTGPWPHTRKNVLRAFFSDQMPSATGQMPRSPLGWFAFFLSFRLSIEHDFFLWAFESLPGPWISWHTCSQRGCPYVHGFPCGLWERQFYSTGHGPGVWQILSLTHNSEQISSPPCPYSVKNEL